VSRFATDLLRIFSVSAIVFNHVSWPFYAIYPGDGSDEIPFVVTLINQIVKPSTALFIFLSGLAFASSSTTDAVSFYKKRALRILPPFLFVSFLYLVYHDQWSVQKFISSLHDGSASYHLYFVVVLFYLYLLFPFLRKVPFDARSISFYILFFTASNAFISFFAPEFWPYSYLLPEKGQTMPVKGVIQYSMIQWLEYFTFGLPLFQAGIWIGLYQNKKKAFSWSMLLLSMILLGIGFAIASGDFLFRISMGLHPDAAGRVWRTPVMIFGAAVIFFLLQIPHRESPALMKKLARSGFLVYLFHPFIIEHFQSDLGNRPYHHFLMVIFLSWVCAILIHEVSVRIPYTGFVFGEGRYPDGKRKHFIPQLLSYSRNWYTN